ncbi:APC family permease [Actinoplanes teichomyceticus]|uniref:Amino acid/polyamine/organocation transporter (APC superfamily) n=1 Tax=Actinoplanes teichomyceticus TaxID=1867 RepID=A0A561WKL9_ACTTI|nr:APC family permease [Actinoplanes teichomyceticus]TWG24411.1 amino acid/polyamine/organocation transporter (APC superfamily) [Actinoplanes teichomyceticus]GIF12738.1 amino acid permease [Actinoplanes teichomyceticus]
MSATTDEPSLKRVIGPGLLLLFVVGDILGTGVYALTGKVATEVGGAVWLPFLLAFVVALLTAFSYLELVTKYPQAAGAALYTHKAFGLHFVTFMVAFAVVCSGLTSASSAAKAFAGNFGSAVHLSLGRGFALTAVALAFMALVALVNFRGVGESVKANVVLTGIELTGLLIVIGVGVWALSGGEGDLSRLGDFATPPGESVALSVTAGTALAFFAMVGFEDSVNMAEETRDPVRDFPRVMLTGISLTGLIYVLVAISAVALVPPAALGEGETPLLKVVQAGAPGFPLWLFAWITMFAVANSALINMMMASRLLYGMANEHVLPRVLGRVHRTRRTPWVGIVFTTLIAFGLIWFADLAALGGTTALLLLCVFTVVNVAVLVLRRDRVGHRHFRAPTAIPVLGALACAFLASPLSGRAAADYRVAGILLLIGVVLWAITYAVNRYDRHERARLDPTRLPD